MAPTLERTKRVEVFGYRDAVAEYLDSGFSVG